MSFEFESNSPQNTQDLGAALGSGLLTAPLDCPLVVSLQGELGAGKTTLVGGLLRGMKITDAVRSPTYTLIESYISGPPVQRPVYHLDLYRLADPEELEMLAPRDLLSPGAVLLVEWAERGGRFLPAADLVVAIEYGAIDCAAASGSTERRRIVLTPSSPAGGVLAQSVHQ